MQRTQIKSIYLAEKDYDGKAITVCGWARSIRASNAFGFIELNDGSCFKNLQVVFEARQARTTTPRSPSRMSARRLLVARHAGADARRQAAL